MEPLKCPECGSNQVESEGQPIRDNGQTIFAKRCQKCRFLWSDRTKPGPAVLADSPDTESATGRLLARAEGFDPESVAVGQVVVFAREGQEKRGPVVRVTRKTVVVDVDGIPDYRVGKDELLGVIVPA